MKVEDIRFGSLPYVHNHGIPDRFTESNVELDLNPDLSRYVMHELDFYS